MLKTLKHMRVKHTQLYKWNTFKSYRGIFNNFVYKTYYIHILCTKHITCIFFIQNLLTTLSRKHIKKLINVLNVYI